jgi:ribosome-binding factor A
MTRRAERVSSRIRQEISELLQEQVNDPRLSGLISITKVTTSPDLKNAKVYVSAVGDNTNKNDVLEGFKAASGYFRREIAERIQLRFVPEITYHFDDSIESGARIIQLIDKVSNETTK